MLGLGKSANKAESMGLIKPDARQVRERLRCLREHRWSSYRAYGNYAAVPEWLVTGELLKRARDKACYRHYVQSYITRGMDPDEFTGLSERVVLGSRDFLNRARQWVGKESSEQPDRSFLNRRIPFEILVSVVEAVRGESWASFRHRHGDWGTAMVLYLARMRSGLTLRQIGDAAGGMAYKSVYERVRRFKQQLEDNSDIQRIYQQCDDQISNMEM